MKGKISKSKLSSLDNKKPPTSKNIKKLKEEENNENLGNKIASPKAKITEESSVENTIEEEEAPIKEKKENICLHLTSPNLNEKERRKSLPTEQDPEKVLVEIK